jgi:8-oxo-dGTP pyrophosphatase MutT (NUDIX family)
MPGFDLDSISALITMGRRYLLQHREDRPDIAFPNYWGLFGGACEAGETAAQALQREMLEELGLEDFAFTPMARCTYDLWFENRRTRKTFFNVELVEAQASKIILGEGQNLGWLPFGEIMMRADRIVPYDLTIIALHHQGITTFSKRNRLMPPTSD